VEHHAPISKECDVVVIGGGAAGLIAAAKTAEEGKKVILLEKLPKLGGGSQYAQGLKLFGTKIEKEAGIPDQMDDYIRSALNTCRWELNPRLIANAFHALPQCFDWMCEWANMDSWALGPTPFGTMAVEPKTHHDAGRFITETMERRHLSQLPPPPQQHRRPHHHGRGRGNHRGLRQHCRRLPGWHDVPQRGLRRDAPR
jgi:succinate dehydrogenase/fumarate reductase flavoprotein subunit